MTLNEDGQFGRFDNAVGKFENRIPRTFYLASPTIGSPRAPGRVDLMGSHTDYNEGFVLTLPINRDTVNRCPAAGRRQRSSLLRSILTRNLNLSLGTEAITGKLDGWGSYVQGVAVELLNSGFSFSGFDAVIHGNVPIGSGLSSSASLEAATATLIEQLGNFSLGGTRKS